MCLGPILLFTTCKKYPENRLWFVNPEKLQPFEGYIKSYKVNGSDGLEDLNNFRNKKLIKRVEDFEFLERENSSDCHHCDNTGEIVTDGSLTIRFNYVLLNKKKQLQIYSDLGDMPTIPPSNETLMTKNIFVESGLVWDIIKLTRKGRLKIKTVHQGNTYEIEIGK